MSNANSGNELLWGFVIFVGLLSVLADSCKSSTPRNPNRDWKGDYQPANKYELSTEEYNAIMEAGERYYD